MAGGWGWAGRGGGGERGGGGGGGGDGGGRREDGGGRREEGERRGGPAHRGLRIGPPFLKWFRSKLYDLFPLMKVSAHRVCA